MHARQILWNKFICFCLIWNNSTHICVNQFEGINWLPITDCFEQCSSSITFNCFNNKSVYMNHIFKPKVVPIPAQECLSAKLINLSEKLITNKKRLSMQLQIFGTAYQILWKQLKTLIPKNTDRVKNIFFTDWGRERKKNYVYIYIYKTENCINVCVRLKN